MMRAPAPLRFAVALVLWAVAVPLAGQDGRVLRIAVRMHDGSPPPARLTLRIADHPPDIQVIDGRAPPQSLVGSPASVTVEVLDDRLTLLFPVDGRIPVPADATTTVQVVVGPDEVSSRLDEVMAFLEDQDADYDQRLDAVLAALADAETRRTTRDQEEILAETAELLVGYRTATLDLLDNLDLLYVSNPDAVQLTEMRSWLDAYNDTWRDLNGARFGLERRLDALWPSGGPLPEAALDALASALDDTHPTVRAVNEPMVEVWRHANGQRDLSDDELAAARERVREAHEAMRASVDRTTHSIDTFLTLLREGGDP
jgi:hypothetical protein